MNGAFLTGDAFNLSVFFDVLPIASYGLMIHSGGAVLLRAGLQYVVVKLAGSVLSLFALGTLYGVPGTVSAAFSADAHHLLVHCLDTDDPDGVRDEIKRRYERRLKEIFE